MRYPIRHLTHVTETATFKRLDQCIPSHWLIRHVSERDYGIDCLVEPAAAPGAPIQGHLMALQLKGASGLAWSPMDTSDARKAGFSGVRVATVNYWQGLPVPVFLCVHEQESNRLFVASVKQQVRRRFRELGDQETFRFDLVSSLDLTEPDGTLLLMFLYLRERAFEGFAEALLDLLFHRESYADYIEGNVELDFFLEVDLAELMRLNRLFSHCQRVVDFSGLRWPVPPLSDFIREDRRLFHEEYTLLHERTHGLVLRQLAPVFVQALRKGVDLVARQERDFWQSREPLLLRYVDQEGASTESRIIQ